MLPDFCYSGLVIKVDPHVVLGVEVIEVDFDSAAVDLNNPGLEPSSDIVAHINPVVEADGSAGLPLGQDPLRVDWKPLVESDGPARVVDEQLLGRDPQHFPI